MLIVRFSTPTVRNNDTGLEAERTWFTHTRFKKKRQTSKQMIYCGCRSKITQKGSKERFFYLTKCFVQLKSILYNLLCVFDLFFFFFQNAGSQLLFRLKKKKKLFKLIHSYPHLSIDRSPTIRIIFMRSAQTVGQTSKPHLRPRLASRPNNIVAPTTRVSPNDPFKFPLHLAGSAGGHESYQRTIVRARNPVVQPSLNHYLAAHYLRHTRPLKNVNIS